MMNVKPFSSRQERSRKGADGSARSRFLLAFVAGLFLGGSQPGLLAADDLPRPEWADRSDALYVLHHFPTSDPTPSPVAAVSPHGLVLSEVFVDSPFGTGWVDPDGPMSSFTRGGTGAWDLGPQGSLSVSIPLWEAPGEVEFVVNVVANAGFFALPTFSVDGHTITDLQVHEELLEANAPWGSWRLISWSGSLGAVAAQELTFLLDAHPVSSSLVDTMEIHVIPEPRAYAAIFGFVALGAALRSWRKCGAHR